MAIVGLSSTGTRKVEVSSDPNKGTADATSFTIGSISARQMAVIKDGAVQYAGKKNERLEIRGNQTAIEIVKFGLKGWDNFLDEAGKEIEFQTQEVLLGTKKVQAVTVECLDRLPFTVIAELSDLISGVNQVDEDERKN